MRRDHDGFVLEALLTVDQRSAKLLLKESEEVGNDSLAFLVQLWVALEEVAGDL